MRIQIKITMRDHLHLFEKNKEIGQYQVLKCMYNQNISYILLKEVLIDASTLKKFGIFF